MVEIISKQQAIEQIKKYFHCHIDNSMYECDVVDCNANIVKIVEQIGLDRETELRILRNHINNMPKSYRDRNTNWVIVQCLLMQGTSHAGRTSSIDKCYELGIDPYSHEIGE